MELEKLKNELAEAQAAVDAKAQAEAAEAQRLAKIQAAVDAEEKRLNSKEYKAAAKVIDEMAKQAEAQKQSIHKAVDALMAEIETWADIVKKRKALAKENRIQASDLFMAEIRIGGNVLQLRKTIEEWKQQIKLRDALNGMYKPTGKKR